MIRGESYAGPGLDVPENMTAKIHDVQVEQTMRMIPLLMFFHSIAAIAVHLVAGETVDIVIREIWPLLCSGVALGFGGLYLSWYRGALKNRSTRAQGLIELLGLALGFVWAMPAAAYALREASSPILPLIAISLTMMGVASISLLRAPIAIVVFLNLMTAALSRSAYLALDDFGPMASAVIVMYGIILLALSLTSHQHFLQNTKSTILLKQQKDFLALLLNDFEETSHDWLWETDRKGCLTYISPRLASSLGLDDKALREGSFRGHLAGRIDPQNWPMLEYCLSAMEDFKPLQVKARTALGDRVWQISGKALTGEDGLFAGFRGVGRDLTAQHSAERKTVDASLAADAAGAAKSRFLSVMSHELRTPIHSIVGFAELLLKDRDKTLPDKARLEFTSSILDQARILQDLINNMLDATRLERGTIKLVEQDIDVAELMELAINSCRAQAEIARVTVVAALVDGIDVVGDTARLKQAFTNVLSNAVKFSVEEGIVHVDMQRRADGGLRIEVRDAGLGINVPDIEKLFEPFAQADDSLTRRFNGLGLGLAIARKIMVLHDGTLTLSSSEGAGTTAVFELPSARVRWRRAPVDERQIA